MSAVAPRVRGKLADAGWGFCLGLFWLVCAAPLPTLLLSAGVALSGPWALLAAALWWPLPPLPVVALVWSLRERGRGKPGAGRAAVLNVLLSTWWLLWFLYPLFAPARES